MTQAPDNMEDPLNLGGGCGWASSGPLPNWSTCPRRRRGAPMYKRRQRYGPKAEYEPPRKQPKYHYGRGPWFQPPRRPAWAMYSHWGHWGGPWHPPPTTFRKPPRQVQVIRVYGLPPFCLCCCSCWCGPWNPCWMRPPGRKKRWGRRGRGLRRPSRRPLPKNPPAELNKLLRPVNVYGWQAPGMRAPPNTTQFIMNQIYEDMRQQEKLDRQQEALRMQQAQAGGQASPAGSSGNDVPSVGGEEETFYGFAQNPSLLLSPAPEEEMQSLIPQLVEEEEEKNEEKYDKVVYDAREESEEEEAEEEAEEEEEEEVEEADYMEEGEEEEEAEEDEGLVPQEDGQREEENPLPLEMPLSVLVGDEEEREDFVSYAYFSPEQIIPQLPQDALFLVPDINC
ncbi:coiled-coil domain-containing glutamate-rich protein 1 [Lepus europaeus]|uniref:coiled-coil domain-containing glutamate-rich protein 1 n=1 Tax=Lepus europaeus TaxID=9983 RepID=UPI002B4736FF|nr:coiled-coil domain-containing glutamate-rich protein 1 [Lepus europaeus]